MVSFDYAYLIGASIGVVGVIEWIKGFDFLKNAPSWIWRVIIVPVCGGVAIAADGGVYQVASNAILLVAIVQIGYPILVQLPTALIQAFRDKIGK